MRVVVFLFIIYRLKDNGSVKSCIKNECYMITGNISDFGLWKCGKGRAFTHITTNLILLFKINSSINHLIKRGRKSIMIKNHIKRRFRTCLLKTLDNTKTIIRRSL